MQKTPQWKTEGPCGLLEAVCLLLRARLSSFWLYFHRDTRKSTESLSQAGMLMPSTLLIFLSPDLNNSSSIVLNPELDTLKLYTKAHGSKTMNLIINLTNDETEILPVDSDASLASFGIG